MQNMLATINNQFSDELNKLLAENNKGDIIRKIWDNDLKENKAAFMKDQAKNTGRRMAENGFAPPPPLGNFADISYLVEN